MRKNRYEMEFPQGQPRVSAITHVIEPVLPGTYAVMTVGGVRSDTRIYAHRLDDSTGTKPGGEPKLTGAAIPLKIVKREGECVTVDIPAKLTGVMAFSLEREFDPENAWIVNRPRLDWGIFSSALRLFLSRNPVHTRSITDNSPISLRKGLFTRIRG